MVRRPVTNDRQLFRSKVFPVVNNVFIAPGYSTITVK